MRHRNLTSSFALCMGLLLGSTAAAETPASAQKAPAKAKNAPAKGGGKSRVAKDTLSPQAKAAIDNAVRLMSSKNTKEVEAGIQSLGLLGTKEAVEPLVTRIRQGLPAELLEAAIVTLMALGQPSAGPALYELTSHRRPEVRLRAVEAITAIHPPGAAQALSAALSDADPKVRAAAATGLGDIGAKDSLEKLFLALDRGNFEASGAIGKVIDPSEVKRLSSYLGKLPFHKLGPALAQVFQRTDVSESAKLELVARLEEVGTKEVKGYLGDLVASSGQALPQAVSRALLRAMQEIAD